MAVEVGQEAPDFTLKNGDNEEVSLSDFRGRKNVVLVFYPMSFSGICTTQLTDIGRHESRYADGGAQVIGVSIDSRNVQRAFGEQLGLTDTILLADFHPKGAVGRMYGVYLEDLGFHTRATFVIDKEGIVQGATVSTVPDIPDEELAFAALSACSV